jgi:hypothetical protein
MLDLKKATTRERDMVKPLVNAVEASAAIIEGVSGLAVDQGALTLDDSLRERDPIIDAGSSLEHFEQLVAAVRELRVIRGTRDLEEVNNAQ